MPFFQLHGFPRARPRSLASPGFGGRAAGQSVWSRSLATIGRSHGKSGRGRVEIDERDHGDARSQGAWMARGWMTPGWFAKRDGEPAAPHLTAPQHGAADFEARSFGIGASRRHRRTGSHAALPCRALDVTSGRRSKSRDDEAPGRNSMLPGIRPLRLAHETSSRGHPRELVARRPLASNGGRRRDGTTGSSAGQLTAIQRASLC
jgi:hypothetical protein